MTIIPLNADGNCVMAMNLDVYIDSIAADLVKAAAPKQSILYLVDARNKSEGAGYVNAVIASSLPEKVLPFYNPETEIPYEMTATPCASCNAVMRRVQDGSESSFSADKHLRACHPARSLLLLTQSQAAKFTPFRPF